ncbi:cysteine synthase [Bacteroidaceae bacterium]|uniref:cysteine synthase A n=1 Tax=Prevotella sp. MGM2 TaxID=2033406 RepID=UPI000CEA000B|nr:cysteine synthase A [Prevotella sp. MGM2]GAY29611.1 cysteine synthase A [Prevotella sp. MGM2]GFI34059.1 cysteine synthase [Bacteroidaceae bacterium]
MGTIYKNLTELVGHTPLLETVRLSEALKLEARLLVKIEYFNPGGSVKDRVALAMIEEAESSGLLRPGNVIIEPTSGNTGVGLAWVAAVKGYRLILTMPETMSVERRKLLQALGAEVVLTPGAEGMKGAIDKAYELQKVHSGAFIPGQFENPANPSVHARTTAEEIWADTDGKVDLFVAGVGTGGTLSGVSRGLRRHNPSVRIFAVEPAASAVLSGCAPGVHKLQGIGAGFVPKNFEPSAADAVVAVTDEAAVRAARLLARYEGLLVGISSGAALHAAIELGRKSENKGKNIVVLLPDTGERYLSTVLYDFEGYVV